MKEKVGIIGSGAGGMAMAVQLGLKGYKVRLCDMPRFDRNIRAVQERGGIKATGKITGFYEPNVVTTNFGEAIEGVDIVFIVARAFGHQEIIEKILTYVESGQIILNWTSYFFSLRFYNMLYEMGLEKTILSEGHILPYFTKIIAPATVAFYGIKNFLKVAAMPSKETNKVLSIIKKLFPQCVAATNVLETSLDNFNFVSHVPPALLNVGWWEKMGGDIEFYGSLITQKVGQVMESVDKERINIGNAFGLKLTPEIEANYLIYEVKGDSIFEVYSALATHSEYRPKMSLDEFAASKALGEDLLYCFVPSSSLGKQIGVDAPVIDALITLACIILQRDYWKDGLTAEKLGLAGMSATEINNYLTQG